MTRQEHFSLFQTLHNEAMDILDKSIYVESETEHERLMAEFDRVNKEAWRHYYIHKRALTRMYNASMKRLERMGL